MRTADRLFYALMLDQWPNSPGAMVDFGLDGYNNVDPQRRYDALHHAVRVNCVTADQLHNAAITGGLTELIRNNNPDKTIDFTTANDMIRFGFGDDDEEEEED